jgi:hypothetical protein
MPLEDLSLRLENLNASANEASRTYAAAVMRELVNPLEAANNLVFLLRLSNVASEDGAALTELLQSQISLLNTVVLSTIQAASRDSLPDLARNPHA